MEVDADIAALFSNEDFRPTALQLSSNSYAKRMNMLCRQWVEFKIALGFESDHGRPFEPCPTQQQIIAFIQWQSRRRKGQFGQKLSLRTVLKYFTEFRLEVKRQTGYEYSRFDIGNINSVSLPV